MISPVSPWGALGAFPETIPYTPLYPATPDHITPPAWRTNRHSTPCGSPHAVHTLTEQCNFTNRTEQ